jgi:hypothetical protein
MNVVAGVRPQRIRSLASFAMKFQKNCLSFAVTGGQIATLSSLTPNLKSA